MKALAAAGALMFAGCVASHPVEPGVGIGLCNVDRGLMVARQVLGRPEDACFDWVEMNHGRAARVVFASGSIWSRRTEYGTGLLTTAAHTLTSCAGGTDCAERLHDPATGRGQAVIKLARPGAGFPSTTWSAHFPLFNVFTPLDQVGSIAILPRYDVSVYVVDSQTFEDDGTSIGIVPGTITNAPLPLHDPGELTKAAATWATVAPGAAVLAVGFANASVDAVGELHVSVGRVLSDDEARQAIIELAAAGDEEGQIPYDPEAELIFEGHAVLGMSGGGVFDEQGRQVGILVRASFADIGVQYVRAVRMSYLVARMQAAYARLSEVERAAVRPYLE